MINFLTPHVPFMASITAPLHYLIKDDIHFQWGPEAHTALKHIKSILCTEPILQFFDSSLRRASMVWGCKGVNLLHMHLVQLNLTMLRSKTSSL